MEFETLPVLLFNEDAIDEWNKKPSDPIKCYLIAYLANNGCSNKKIKELLGIEKSYTLTHYKRVGLSLSEEQILMWLRNKHRVKLGHMRAIAKLKESEKEKSIEKLCTKKLSVRRIELEAKNKEDAEDVDIKAYQRDIEESTGRTIKIKYNQNKKTGTITMSYYCLDDLDFIVKAIGYNG